MSTWILLRGLMRESRHWDDFPALLDAQLQPSRIVLAELPGNGKLNMLASPAHVEDMVHCYRSALLGAGIGPPYHILGLSMGGMAAVAWAHRFPAELAACVLVNTSLRPFSPFYRRLHWRNYPALFRLLCSGDVMQHERLILRLTSVRGASDEQLVRRWAAYRKQYPVSRRNALSQLAAAACYRAPAHRPDVPLLILASKGDRLVDPACSLRLARTWRADLALHPDAGHDLPLDDGAWVARAVRTWLHGLSPHRGAVPADAGTAALHPYSASR